MRTDKTARSPLMEDPPLAKKLFGDPRFAWLWLPIRLFLGWEWLSHGLEKLSNPKWMDSGEALKGFWMKSVQVPPPPAKPPIAYDWYREFIGALLTGGHYTWFSKVVVFGELLIGAALIVGAFTGIAAFFGGFMNWNFLMAGTAATNPLLFAVATWLVLAWKNAGYIGADRWVLRSIGTPWKPGLIFNRKPLDPEPSPIAGGR